MKIPLNLSRVRYFTFKDEATNNQVRLAYAYCTGDFETRVVDSGNSDVGVQMQKLRIDTNNGLGLAELLSAKLKESGKPVQVQVTAAMRQQEGKPVTLEIVGL